MIKGITGSRYVVVEGGSVIPPYISPGARSSGMIRWNDSTHDLEVYDGAGWQRFNSMYPTIQLDSSAVQALDWVRKKMKEEEEYIALSKKHPAVKAALDNLENAKQQLDVTIILSKEHEHSTN